ncbi:MAG TPA: DUF6636 domain-containing protein [Gaiellales bacterium]|nr:DUF6636 domain-containing protein [Gaiellales bacterium]
MLAADLRHRHLAAQRREHQLELLLRRELAVLPGLAQLISPSVERPILGGCPDAISASALRASAPTAPGQTSHEPCQRLRGERTKFDYGNSFGMTPRGRAHALCVSDSVIDPHAVVLRYGTTRRFGPFVCRSRTIGLRCTNRVRHGFFRNQTNYRLF